MKPINKKILQFFDVLSDETRLRILLSVIDGPKAVNDIHKNLDELTLSAISHQLKQLNDQGIIEFDKKGREKFVSLSKNFCWCILKDALDHFDKKCKCKACAVAKENVRRKIR